MSNAELMALRDEDLPCEVKPIVDSVEQRRSMDYAGMVLRSRFAHREDVTVGVDLGLFYLPEDERGGVPIAGGRQDTPARYAPLVVPDVMVAFGVQRRRFGGSYQTWNMGKVPDFVLEVASTSTWRHDYARKRDLYERLGVWEYFVYDARGGPSGAHRVAGRRDPLASTGRCRPPRTRVWAWVSAASWWGWWRSWTSRASSAGGMRRSASAALTTTRNARDVRAPEAARERERTGRQAVERMLTEEREQRRKAELAATESTARIAELEARVAALEAARNSSTGVPRSD